MDYQIWITIVITHQYYLDGCNGLILKPCPHTQKLLTRTGIILKQSASNKWLLLKQKGINELLEEELIGQMEFYLLNRDKDFYYHTNHEVTNGIPLWELKDVAKNGIWKTLTIYIEKEILTRYMTINMVIDSAKRFLEFVVIAKSGYTPILMLTEENNKLNFKQSSVDFPQEPLPVYRFLSSEPVALKEVYTYKISLWEIKEKGKTLVSSFLPFPKSSAMSILNSTNTISSYFYF